MKNFFLLLACIVLSTTLLGNEDLNVLVPTSDFDETIIFDEKQQIFVDSIKQELENTKSELTKYKTNSDKNVETVKNSSKKWNHELYFGIEQEINSDSDWKFLDSSLATSPYTGMFLYKDDSKFLYDIQFLKTFIDHLEEYNRNRFSAGITYRDSFKLNSGKTGNYGLRLGYRNDSYHWSSMTESTSIPTYSGYIRKGEERNELWIRPTGSLNMTSKIRMTTSLSFRIIDRELDYARFGKEYAATKRDWSNIQEHSLGMRYTLDNKNFMSLDYQFVRENLVRTLLNTEHFAMVRYFHFLSNKDTFSPYVRVPLGKGEQKYYNGVKEVVRVDKVTRPRIGIQYKHNINSRTSLFFDVYYRPQNIDPSNGSKRHENFFLWVAELNHKF
ncbi:MAG: hypothetical protein ACRC0S_04180 [Fusobacteriaceae bacterium]